MFVLMTTIQNLKLIFSGASCCTAGIPFMFMMASRAYEVLKWDYPVCQENCKKRQEIETTTTATQNSRQASPQKSDASVRRKVFSERIGLSVFYSDGEDSDAQFPGTDKTRHFLSRIFQAANLAKNNLMSDFWWKKYRQQN